MNNHVNRSQHPDAVAILSDFIINPTEKHAFNSFSDKDIETILKAIDLEIEKRQVEGLSSPFEMDLGLKHFEALKELTRKREVQHIQKSKYPLINCILRNLISPLNKFYQPIDNLNERSTLYEENLSYYKNLIAKMQFELCF